MTNDTSSKESTEYGVEVSIRMNSTFHPAPVVQFRLGARATLLHLRQQCSSCLFQLRSWIIFSHASLPMSPINPKSPDHISPPRFLSARLHCRCYNIIKRPWLYNSLSALYRRRGAEFIAKRSEAGLLYADLLCILGISTCAAGRLPSLPLF
jgi:hypothetical protein